MIHFTTYLRKEAWRISVYVLESCGEGADVLEELASMGCRGKDFAEVTTELMRCGMNIGITYSVGPKRNTLMVIGEQSDKVEFVNTLRHEQHHIISHICQEECIDMNTERSAYIAGDVGASIYEEMRKYNLI